MLWTLLTAFCLLAQSTSTLVVGANGATSLYPIDPSQRGKDLIEMFNYLKNTSPPVIRGKSFVSMQTTLSSSLLTNGFIPNIVNIVPTVNYTLLIVNYNDSLSGSGQNNDISLAKHIVVPVEQITDIIFEPAPFSTTPTYGSTTNPVLPVYAINLNQRANDIISVFNILNTQKPYKNIGTSKVSLQTTLTGPYKAPFANGLIPNVQAITFANGQTTSSTSNLLLVAYTVKNNSNQIDYLYISLSAEQILSVIYSN